MWQALNDTEDDAAMITPRVERCDSDHLGCSLSQSAGLEQSLPGKRRSNFLTCVQPQLLADEMLITKIVDAVLTDASYRHSPHNPGTFGSIS